MYVGRRLLGGRVSVVLGAARAGGTQECRRSNWTAAVAAPASELPSGESLLRLWFGTLGPSGELEEGMEGKWFQKNDEFDRRLAQLYSGALEEAEQNHGALKAWEPMTPRMQLARVLLLDQIPRNIRRGTAGSFSCDIWALEASREALELSWDENLAEIEHAFLLMPFMHSESLETQTDGVKRFYALANGPSSRPDDSRTSRALQSFYEFAEKHRAVIERFGRFPHRNRILGRRSTPAEEEFLLQPGSSF